VTSDSSPPRDITELLLAWNGGDEDALEELVPKVYAELHRIAEHAFRSERRGHTLQSTVLVHETYLRLIDQNRVEWKNRAHFYGIASRLMRRILVDHARARGAAKRGYGRRIELDEALLALDARNIDLIDLDGALDRLADLDPRQAQIVELRFFGGLTIEETSHITELSPATVKREWSVARAWLHAELHES